MQERLPIDSRDYMLAFELRSIDDCPPDFELPSSMAGFDAGLFLPRGDRDWLGQPLYPPRILLLKGGWLHIVSHPSTGDLPRRCAIEQIASVESGQMLLKGWLRFTGSGFDCTVGYNTLGFRSVFRFMGSVRNELLRGTIPLAAPLPLEPGLDIKFANALALELDSGEAVLLRAFQPPGEAVSRSWLLSRHRHTAGDLLALTGRRLLWITDRTRGFHSPYGSIASYAPLDAVRGIAPKSSRGGPSLQVDLSGGSAWQIPCTPASPWDCHRLADEFAAAIETQKRGYGAGRTELRR
jgi:hypothetical protein